MIDMNRHTQTRSNRLNAEDLVGTSITIKVTQVRETGKDDIPIVMSYEGDNGKPFEPCLTVRKILKAAWGEDGESYAGKSMTLYCDDDVKFGGASVGGVRVSHLSHMDKPLKVSLMVTRGKKKLFTIEPLQVAKSEPSPEQKQQAAKKAADKIIEKIDASEPDDIPELIQFYAETIERLKAYPELHESIMDAVGSSESPADDEIVDI